MGRLTPYHLLVGLGVAALGCSDSNPASSPTSPDLTGSTTGCDVSTARNQVNTIFPSNERQTARNLLQAILDGPPGSTAATTAVFDLLELIEIRGPASPSSGATFVNAIIRCQNLAGVTVPTTFIADITAALGQTGGFGVRGRDDDQIAVVSHDRAWGMEPTTDADLARYTWNNITGNVAGKRFLAYGMPVSIDGFTKETAVGTIFDWFTVPTLAFATPTLPASPGLVVGTCTTDATGSEYLIQHNAFGNGGEIVPSATPSFCSPGLTGIRENQGWSLIAVAHRLVDLFKPQPLLAAALGTRPPGGSIGNLSPSLAINPGVIKLSFNGTVADGKTGVALTLKAAGNPPVSVTVAPGSGLTPMDGVRVKLIAVNNLGTPVVVTGNFATTENGFAVFPDLKISKPGGYRIIATLDAFGQNSASGYNFSDVRSNGFNLKQNK